MPKPISKTNKILEKVLFGYSDANVDFDDLRKLLVELGFTERIKGSHHIFTQMTMKKLSIYNPNKTRRKLIRSNKFVI